MEKPVWVMVRIMSNYALARNGNRNLEQKIGPKNYGHKKEIEGITNKIRKILSPFSSSQLLHTLSSRFNLLLMASRKSIVYR